MTSVANNLSDYYTPGEQIVTFDNANDLVDKVRYYLSHEQERKRIADAGRLRTLAEHTYEQRFNEIFNLMQQSTVSSTALCAA